MGDETTKIFLNSKGKREGIDSDLAAFLDYIEGKTQKGNSRRPSPMFCFPRQRLHFVAAGDFLSDAKGR